MLSVNPQCLEKYNHLQSSARCQRPFFLFLKKWQAYKSAHTFHTFVSYFHSGL